MTSRYLAGPIVAAIVIVTAGGAQATPADDYVTLMTAIEVDKACMGLKYMEHYEAKSLAFARLEASEERARLQSGAMTDADYRTWFAALNDKIRGNVAAVGCTEQALQFILPARAVAAEALYQGLALAFHFDAETPLDDHRKATAASYETYLQQLYGESFAAFVERQRAAASARLPESAFDPVGADSFDIAATRALMEARGLADRAMNAVQLEVTAEAHGYLVRPFESPSATLGPQLMTPAGLMMPVVDGPSYRLVDLTPTDTDDLDQELFSVIVTRPDRGMRIIFYGTTASLLGDSTVRLYVRNEPTPSNSDGWTTFSSPSFRQESQAFDATRVSPDCLGAPCYDLPPAATEAVLATAGGDLAELFIASGADAEPPAITDSFDRGTLGNVRLKDVLDAY
jgi:hypothetical protein